MNIEASFGKLIPVTWSHCNGLQPIARARHFAVPLEEDIDRATLAMTLVAEIIGGKQNAAGVRWKYSGNDQRKAACFNLGASFYSACFFAMRDIMAAETPAIAEMWPCLEFDDHEKCHATCRSLKHKRLPRKNAALRTFYPPWHFGCAAFVSDTEQKASRNFSLSITPTAMEYYHNPYDVLVAQGLIADFPGLDFGPHASAVCELGGMAARLLEGD